MQDLGFIMRLLAVAVAIAGAYTDLSRSEERRVGKECRL